MAHHGGLILSLAMCVLIASSARLGGGEVQGRGVAVMRQGAQGRAQDPRECPPTCLSATVRSQSRPWQCAATAEPNTHTCACMVRNTHTHTLTLTLTPKQKHKPKWLSHIQQAESLMNFHHNAYKMLWTNLLQTASELVNMYGVSSLNPTNNASVCVCVCVCMHV